MITPTLKEMMKAFEAHGYLIRLVGGCVRDLYLGKDPKDIDLCTDAKPDVIEEFAHIQGWSFHPTGIDHGTVTLVVNDEVFEVTTLRVDTETDGRHAKVEFTSSFEADAARRDFTMNAMFMDKEGKIYDYFGGREDLDAGVIRFVGEPEARIREDYLRILRFFRFMVKMDLTPRAEDLIDIKLNVEGLKNISVERWWLEMSKLMSGSPKDYYQVLYQMDRLGVLAQMDLKYDPKVKMAVNALSALAAMKPDKDQWKLSATEKKSLNYFWNVWFGTSRYSMPIGWYQDRLVDGMPMDVVVQLAIWKRDSQFIPTLKAWEVPVFPVKGQDFLDRGWTPGPEIGKKMKELFDLWRQSRYTMSKEDLINGCSTDA